MTPEKNKSTVTAFYDLNVRISRSRLKPFDGYVGKTYPTQHNPVVADGKDALIEVLRSEWHRTNIRINAWSSAVSWRKASFVVLHCHQHWPEDGDWAGIDIFRLDDDGKIVEHWDVLQRIPNEAANSNTMF